MSNVGLIYSAAALIMNGLVLIGTVSSKAAAPFNFLVGAMQVVFPTIALMQANGDLETIISASAVYLFGITYLYVAYNAVTGTSGEGLGWFALFVAACAAVYSFLEFRSGGYVYGVLWLFWGTLWFLFFLMLARERKELERFIGWFTLLLGIFTAGIPGFWELAGGLPDNIATGSIALALCAGLLALAWMLGRAKATTTRDDVPRQDVAV